MIAAASLRVEQQLTETRGKRILTTKLKTPSSYRTIELTPDCLEVLQNHRKEVLKTGVRDLVFIGRKSAMLWKSRFSERDRYPLLSARDIAPRGFHHTRHTYATLQLAAKVPVHIVAVMGHKDANTLLKIYADVLEGMQNQASESMAQMLG